MSGIRRCRLCAYEGHQMNFCSIFDENPPSDIEIKITKLLPVVVVPWDRMPHKICRSCIDKLNHFDEFYEGCLRAERFFQTSNSSATDEHSESFNSIIEVPGQSLLNKTFAFSSQNCDTSFETPETLSVIRESDPKRTLNCFIINELSEKDFIFTCRKCFRIFTKESSALKHACDRLEDCEESRMENRDEGQKTSLPPLKIRLFSRRSGLFVCYQCQAQFREKEIMWSHLKVHFEKEKWKRKSTVVQREKRRKSDEDNSLKNVIKRARKRKRKNWRKIKQTHSITADNGNSLSTLTKKAVDSPRRQDLQNELGIFDEEKCKMTCEEPKKKSKTCAIEGAKWEESRVKSENEEIIWEELESQVKSKKEQINSDVESRVESKKEEINSNVVHEEFTTDKLEEVTVIEVVDKKSPTSFSSCVFCDKVFATNGALIAHQRKHLRGYFGAKFKNQDQNHLLVTTKAKLKLMATSSYYSFPCSTCAMMFTNKKTLLEHEQYHRVDVKAIG